MRLDPGRLEMTSPAVTADKAPVTRMLHVRHLNLWCADAVLSLYNASYAERTHNQATQTSTRDAPQSKSGRIRAICCAVRHGENKHTSHAFKQAQLETNLP